jgi:4-methyl-5(b-hydroxyethyl)-thiazole monophosphate biosynthesis
MKAAVLLAEGFEEIEFSTIVDILRRAGIDVLIAGLRGGEIIGSHGIKVVSDVSLDRIGASDLDAVVLPGGSPGFMNLSQDGRVIRMVKEMYDEQKYVAAICGAPFVLSQAGILDGKRVTIHPSLKGTLTGARYVDDRVVVDGKIVTSQGPGTAMEFSLKLVEIWVGRHEVEEVNKEVLARL